MSQQGKTFRKLGGSLGARERSEPRFGQAPAYLQNTTVKQRVRGYVLVEDPDTGRAEGDTTMCVHCGFHWVIQPGSGRQRGFCLMCNGPTCGKRACSKGCTPLEKAMEERERNAARPWWQRR